MFLYVTVSPSACNNEFKATKIIKATDPLNTTLVYSRLNESTSFSDPINENRSGAKKRPIKVINKDIFGFLNIEGSVGSKKTAGGTALEEVEKQIKKAKDIIKEYEQDL